MPDQYDIYTAICEATLDIDGRFIRCVRPLAHTLEHSNPQERRTWDQGVTEAMPIEQLEAIVKGEVREKPDNDSLRARYAELVILQKKYIKMLGKECKELMMIAHNRGWKSSRYELGIEMRAEMKEVEDKILKLEPDIFLNLSIQRESSDG